MSDLHEKLNRIKLLAMDFDGIHTDGYVYLDQNGNESVRCSRRDSLGLEMIRAQGITLCVISKEKNPVVLARCQKLNIECYQGVKDSEGKRQILEDIMRREQVEVSQVIFMGDDVNDIEALKYAGIGVTVADGHEKVKAVADLILTRKGGEHAIRELCDLLLESKS